MKKRFGNLLNRSLNFIEVTGNKLPHPATLFLIFALAVPVFSLIAHWLNWTAVNPSSNEVIKPFNLLSEEGLHMMLNNMVTNFTGFAPLGVVLVALLGIGVAEESGLISALVRKLVLSAPSRILTFVVILTGILSNIASNVGYVLLIPLAGVIYIGFRRHPIVGMAAAFAGVSGGFSANLLLGTVDPLLAGITEEAAQLLDKDYTVNPTANYYFMAVSTIFIALVGTFITERISEPRYAKAHPFTTDESFDTIQPHEKKGLRAAGITALVLLSLILLGMIPAHGYLRGEGGSLLKSPVIKGIVAVIFLIGAICGVAYGLASGKFKNDSDIMKGMEKSMSSVAGYLVLVFFASQFVAYFSWSNLGVIFAVKGASFLEHLNLSLPLLIILFILLSGTINLFIGSASAKWALMAPIFVPMFMLMGYTPELSQVIYRIGDSVTNIITPMMDFFVLIIAFFKKYDKNAGMGTIISMMIPYTVAFFIVWSLLLIIWIKLGLPLGPGVGIFY
ncbi:MAG: AbgT family transporter [Bacteroidales bacterium]|nr:AbgT family transporter [Bacteroidales bacterium]